MASWMEQYFVAIDTETTGLDFNSDRVIQLGISTFNQGKWQSTSTYLINSGWPSSAEAVATHGISNAMQEDQGIKPVIALRAAKSVLENTTLAVIMNAPFDLNMLFGDWKRNAIHPPVIPYIIDPLVISRFYEKNRIPSLARGKRTLKALSERFGIHDYPLHSAGHDSRRVGELAIEMGRRNGQLGRSRIIDLHRKQIKWHDYWCKDFASYADRKGFSFNVTSWPYNWEAVQSDPTLFDARD